jgi:hypothetical protein
MGFFRRDKEPQVTIAYKNGPKVALVMTPDGPVPLQQIVDRAWVEIAALAWWGYRKHGPGLVKFDDETGDMGYFSAEAMAAIMQGLPLSQDILDACGDYIPDTQVVLLTGIVFSRGFRRDPDVLLATLTMPKGGVLPVAAWAMVERLDEVSNEYAARRAQALGPDA